MPYSNRSGYASKGFSAPQWHSLVHDLDLIHLQDPEPATSKMSAIPVLNSSNILFALSPISLLIFCSCNLLYKADLAKRWRSLMDKYSKSMDDDSVPSPIPPPPPPPLPPGDILLDITNTLNHQKYPSISLQEGH